MGKIEDYQKNWLQYLMQNKDKWNSKGSTGKETIVSWAPEENMVRPVVFGDLETRS
jgi:hypothetical protein